MGVMRISAHFLTSDVGIGSRSHDLDGEDFRILSSSSSDTGVKEEFIFSGVVLVTDRLVVDYCSVYLIEGFCHRELTESVCKVRFICVVW